MSNKKYVYGFMTLAILATVATAVPAFADNNVSSNQPKGGRGMMNRDNIKPGIFGTVSAVNGNTITVSGKQGFGTSAVVTTFTVDATNAKITKNNVTGTISNVLVGDTIMAQGTLTGTNLVATMIRDGQIGKGMRNDSNISKTSPVSPITGNGQPIVAGTILSISGSTLTITNKSNVSYTIDATNAKIIQDQNTISASNLAVGNMIVVQGSFNGNSVIATSIIDQAKPTSPTATAVGANKQPHQGFFAGVGSFFAHIFGF